MQTILSLGAALLTNIIPENEMGSGASVITKAVINEPAESAVSEISTTFAWEPDSYGLATEGFPQFILCPPRAHRPGRPSCIVNCLNIDAPKMAKYEF